MYNILCTPCILLLAFMCHTIEYGLQKKMQRTVKIPLLPLSQVSITFLYVRYSPKKVLAVKLFFIHLYISVVLKGLDRAESSDIHGFVAHAWDVKCPSIRKMGASLWISDVIFFSSYPFFFMLHLWAVCQKLRNAPGYFEFSRNQNNLERLLPQMKEMSTNKKSSTQRVRS